MIRGRLAPSPTGALHLGNARTFLLAWLSLRAQGGQVVLRIEDLDGPRVKPETVSQLIGDLQWLGLDWDEGPYVQTQRIPLYQAAWEQLAAAGQIYPCRCSRTDIERAASAPHVGDEGPPYPGTCRPKTATPESTPFKTAQPQLAQPHREHPELARPELARPELAQHELAQPELAPPTMTHAELTQPRAAQAELPRVERTSNASDERDPRERKPAWRFRVPAEAIPFDDGFSGPQVGNVAESSGDFVVWKGTGTAAYQLAVVVDDAAMAITEVVRGDDLLSSTPRQLLLYQALGLAPPRFWHVPLVVGLDGRRLAKRHGDTRICWFRESGVRPERLVGWLAWQCGLGEPGGSCVPADLIDRFGWSKVPRERIVCDRESVYRLLR